MPLPVTGQDTTTTTESTSLTRAVGGPLLLFVLGDVLGAGIYTLVGEVAGRAGNALWLPLAVALGLALLTAASYVELVTRFPRAGGAALFAHRAYRSDLVSFLVGWCGIAAGVTSVAGLAVANLAEETVNRDGTSRGL
jgi:amino acid transporter